MDICVSYPPLFQTPPFCFGEPLSTLARGSPDASREAPTVISGGTKRATSINMPRLRLQSSEGKFTTSREFEPVLPQVLPQAQKLHIHGSGTFGAFGLSLYV